MTSDEMDEMSALWESEKHLLTSDALRVYMSRAVMAAREMWHGHRPPTPRPLTARLHECAHRYNIQSSGFACIHCGEIKTVLVPGKFYV